MAQDEENIGATDCGWKPGPLPPKTFNWGGVVVNGQDGGGGFLFADFWGDHVKVGDRRIEAWEVKFYNNCLGPAPREAKR